MSHEKGKIIIWFEFKGTVHKKRQQLNCVDIFAPQKFQFIQLIQTIVIFIFFLSVVWLSWNFVRFHEILFQTDAQSFSFLTWKIKKFYSWKKKF